MNIDRRDFIKYGVLGMGAAAFLKKPITQKMLLETIERLLPPEN